MRCSECGREYDGESGGCQWCGAVGPVEGPYREFLPLRGLGGLLTGLLVLTTELIAAQLMLRAYGGASGLPWASRQSSRLGDAGEAALLVTGITFVVWFRRARINAENSSWRQRRACGWTFWGWIVPIASLFVPFQLMGDIWRAGLPAARREKTAWLPALWWTAWLLSGEGTTLTLSIHSGGSSPPSHSLHGASTFSLCVLAISGTLVIPIILKVSTGPVAGAPAAWDGGPARPRTRRKTPPLVVAALLAAVLGMAGLAAAAVGIIGVSTYHADTVHLSSGNTVQAVLSPGIYHVFAGCATDTACPQLQAGELSVQGTLSTPPGLVSDNEHEKRVDAGQPFIGELIFGIPVQESMRFTLHTSQPALIAPSDDRLLGLRGWIAVAAISGMVLFGLPAALAWLLARRDADGTD